MNMIEGVPTFTLDELPSEVLIKAKPGEPGGDARTSVRCRPNRGNMILPEGADGRAPIYSDSAEFRNFQWALYERCTAEMPRSEAREGRFDARAVPTGWESLLYTSGYIMRPRSMPLYNNEGVCDERGVPRFWLKPVHEKIANIVADIMTSQTMDQAQAYHAKRVARSGAPFRVTDDQPVKKGAANWLAVNYDSVVEGVCRGNYEEMARKLYAVWMSIVGGRAQASDKGEVKGREFSMKARPIFDLPYSITGGRLGTVQDAQRRLPVEPPGTAPIAHAMRDRLVNEMNSALNHNGSSLLVDRRAAMFDKLAFTFHHGGIEDVTRKVRRKRVLSLDAPRFEQHLRKMLRDKYWEALARNTGYTRDELQPLEQVGYPNALLMAHDTGTVCIGDPYKRPANGVHGTMPSGHFSNIDEGKTCFMIAYMCAAHDVMGRYATDEAILRFLKGEDDWQDLNLTDDNWSVYEDPALRRYIRQIVDRPKGWYVPMEYEEAGSFSGLVAYCRRWDDPDTLVAHNPVTLLSNVVAPEHGVDHPSRKFWWLGWRQRVKIYGDAPMAGTAWGILYDTFKKVYGYDLDNHVSPYVDPDFESRSAADMRFLDNPASLYYKLDPRAISPEVLNLFYATYMPQEVAYLNQARERAIMRRRRKGSKCK